MSLIYECCADLGVTDRIGDLIQKKLHSFQAAQVARQLQTQNLTAVTSPRIKKSVLEQSPKSSDEGFICGSAAFQELAGFSSSYEGQVPSAFVSSGAIYPLSEDLTMRVPCCNCRFQRIISIERTCLTPKKPSSETSWTSLGIRSCRRRKAQVRAPREVTRALSGER